MAKDGNYIVLDEKTKSKLSEIKKRENYKSFNDVVFSMIEYIDELEKEIVKNNSFKELKNKIKIMDKTIQKNNILLNILFKNFDERGNIPEEILKINNDVDEVINEIYVDEVYKKKINTYKKDL